MKRAKFVYLGGLAVLLCGVLLIRTLNASSQSAVPSGSATALPPSQTPPPAGGTDTPTPVAQFFAPAVFDTASTATYTPVPTVTPLYTATPGPTDTPPPAGGTDTPTPAGQFFAPAVFDTASTATHTPVPTVTPLYTATPGPTRTYPPP